MHAGMTLTAAFILCKLTTCHNLFVLLIVTVMTECTPLEITAMHTTRIKKKKKSVECNRAMELNDCACVSKIFV